MHNKLISFVLSAAVMTPLISAEMVNGPDFKPPFASERTALQKAEFKIRSFLDQRTGKSAEQPSFVIGNKRISIRDLNGNMRTNSDTQLPVYVNNKLVMTIGFDGACQTNGIWKNIVVQDRKNDTSSFVVDQAKQTVIYRRPWIRPDGKTVDFTYTLSASDPGKIELNWNTGCSEDEFKKFNKENLLNWNVILSFPGDYRSQKIDIDGKALTFLPEKDFSGFKTTSSWKGVRAKVEVKQAPVKFGPLSRMEWNPQSQQECVKYLFPDGYKGFNTESAYMETGEKTRFGMFYRITDSKLSPSGKLVIDFGAATVKKADAPPPVEGHDLWAEDALHMPHSPNRNLFPNPSFEQGLRYWTWVGGGSTYSRSATMRFQTDDNGLFGKKALVINPTQHGSASLMSFSLPGKKGESYVVSFYAKSEKPGSSAQLTLFSQKSGGKFGRPYYERDKMLPITTEWKRYSQTFVSDGAPTALALKATGNGGKVWLDGIQYERGNVPSGFVSSPLEGNLVCSSDPDGNLEFGKEGKLEFEVSGKKDVSGKIELTLFDFYKSVILQKEISGKGGSKVLLPLEPSKLDPGIYILRAKFTVPGTKPYYDFYRFTVLKSLNGTHATKNLYGALMDTRTQRTEDYLKLMERAGFGGSSSYGAGKKASPIAYELREKFNITDYTHKLGDGLRMILSQEEIRMRTKNPTFKLMNDLRRGWMTEEEKKGYQPITRYTDDILQKIESLAYKAAKENPYIRVWSFSTEEECAMPPVIERNFKEFAKLQMAFHKGIKRGNPKALVLPSGGTSGYGKMRGYDLIDGYLKATKGKVKWDAIAVHPYGAIDGTLGNTDLDECIAMLSKNMEENGYGKETPIYLNEGYGEQPYRWGDGPDYSYSGGHPSYDLGLWEFLHASKMARVYIMCMKYPQVEHFNTWQSLSRTTVDVNLSLAAAMKAINTLGNLLPAPKFIDDIRPAAGMRGYGFQDEKGRGVAALWCTLDNVERGFERGPVLNVKFDGKLPELIDLMGKSYPLKAEKDGSVRIQLTPAPLFLRGENPKKLIESLKKADVIGAGSSIRVSFAPDLNGTISAKMENLTGREQTGVITVDGKKLEFQVEAKKTKNIPVAAPGKPVFGKLFRWNADYILNMSKTAPIPDTWKMDYFYVPHVNGTPDWNRIPSIPITNMFRPVVNFKQTPGGHKGDIAADFKMAWNKENLYLRVEAEDDFFDVANPKFWSSPQAKKKQLYMLDGCLEVYFDCGANGRMSNGGYDLDDYRYDFCAGNSEGKSGPGLVNRLREVYLEYALGVQMATKEEAAEKIKCEFTRISPTKYAYTITFGQRYLEPLRLSSGTMAGFGLYLHDADKGQTTGGKGLTLATEPGSHCDFKPQVWPLMILAK